MDGVPCQGLRLNKKESLTTRSIFLQSADDRSTSKFLCSRRLVVAQSKFKNYLSSTIKRLFKGAHHTSHVPSIEAITDPVINNADLNKSNASSKMSDDGTVVFSSLTEGYQTVVVVCPYLNVPTRLNI